MYGPSEGIFPCYAFAIALAIPVAWKPDLIIDFPSLVLK